MEENKKLKIILVIFILLIIFIAIILAITKETKKSDFTINLSTLPQEQLWTIDHANQMLEKAFHIGFLFVQDEEAMLELVKHAYQWDKNAMIVYAEILYAIDEHSSKLNDNDLTLGKFLKKYSYELVDNKGNPLVTPAIFDLSYYDFMSILAQKGYIYPMNFMIKKLRWKPGETDGIYNPLIEQDRKLLVEYTKKLIQHGFKYQSILADFIVFDTAKAFKDSFYTNLNKLNEHIPTLSNEELKEAITNYHICAIHGKHSCLVRLVEANRYGIGTQQDYKKALAWSQLANTNYQYYLEKAKQDIEWEVSGKTVDRYNQALIEDIKKYLTPKEIEQASELAKQLEQSIITWDYDQWASQREPIPPQP